MIVRKLLVLVAILLVFAISGIWTLADWLTEVGAVEAAIAVRHEFLTGTAIAVILALLVLLPDRWSKTRCHGRDQWPFD